jgi:hypothetical protein
MRKLKNSQNDFFRVRITLDLEKDQKFYAFSMLETTFENGKKLINETNKTIHASITSKVNYGQFVMQLEIFDFEYKNKNVSVSEKDFISKMADISDNLILEITQFAGVRSISNLDKIQQRLEEKIKKMAENNVGEKVEQTFQYLREFYKNEKRIILDTKNYKQHGLLLHSFYGDYSPTYSTKRKVRYLNFMDNTVVNIQEEAKVGVIEVNKRELEICINAIIDEPFYNSMFLKSLEEKEIVVDLVNDKASLDKYEGSIIIDMDSGMVKRAHITIEFSFGKNYKKTINYQLKEVDYADNN